VVLAVFNSVCWLVGIHHFGVTHTIQKVDVPRIPWQPLYISRSEVYPQMIWQAEEAWLLQITQHWEDKEEIKLLNSVRILATEKSKIVLHWLGLESWMIKSGRFYPFDYAIKTVVESTTLENLA
ncbi:hypothetical protein ACJX0J_011060, partial [Zea mays]